MKRVILGILTLIVIVIGLPTKVYGVEGDKYCFDIEQGHWVKEGGLNTFDCVEPHSRQEAYELSQRLIYEEGYVQVSGNGRLISDEEYALVKGRCSFWFTMYMEEDDYGLEYEAVFMYKASYDSLIEILKNTPTEDKPQIPDWLFSEISTSTVVIGYDFWYFISKENTICDEFNDNIPSWFETAYLEIRSPVNCTVKLWNVDLNRYHVFYVVKNTPFLVKLKQADYRVVLINDTQINDNMGKGEDALPYNNRIQLSSKYTKDNPYLLDFTRVVTKHNIKDGDIVGKPDLSFGQNQKIPTEHTTVKDNANDEQEAEKVKQPINIPLLVILVLIVVLFIIYLIRQSKIEKEDD